MKYPEFSEIFLPEWKFPVISYRTGMTVYEEAFENGIFYSCGWNTAGYPLNVLQNTPTRFTLHQFTKPSAFRFCVNGTAAYEGMSYLGTEILTEGNTQVARVKLTNLGCDVNITVETRLDGTQVLARRLVVENIGAAEAAISDIAIMSGGVEVISGLQEKGKAAHCSEKLYSVGYMQLDTTLHEGDFGWRPLPMDEFSFAGRYDRERYRYPMVMLRNNLMGSFLYAQLAWSGGYRFCFDLDAHPLKDVSKLAWSAELEGHLPQLLLAPGEVFESPWLHVCMLQGDLDDAVNAMHDHSRRSILNNPLAEGGSCAIGAGMGPEHDMSVEISKRYIDQMGDMGAEVFIIDAGWNCPPGLVSEWFVRNGDWEPNAKRYPNGLAELREYCHARGMKFGMWMEPERLGEWAPIRKEHPEWMAMLADGTRSAHMIDMTNPEAAAWIENEIARFIEREKLDLFRLDEAVQNGELHYLSNKPRREDANIRHTKAVYAMFTRLRQRFPGVIFENCASGGGRCDLGMMPNFHHTWVSDNQFAPRSVIITEGMTMVLPPERVDRLVSGMGCHTAAEFSLHMRNAMFGHISMNVVASTSSANPQQMTFIHHSLQIYKEFIRPMLSTAHIYHHTPEAGTYLNGTPAVLELASPVGDKVVLGAFAPTDFTGDTLHIVPKGVAMSGSYRVTWDNSGATAVMTGTELGSCGVTVRLKTALSSELVLIEKVEI